MPREGKSNLRIYPTLKRNDVTRTKHRYKGEAREVKVEVIVCFSARPLSRALSSEISLLKPFMHERNAALSPAMCFEWIYMTSHRVPTSLFAGVHTCVCVAHTRAYACPCARVRVCVCARVGQHVGRDSLQRQMLDHLPVAPSRYETWYDYTLSAHRGQGRTVLPASSTRPDLLSMT